MMVQPRTGDTALDAIRAVQDVTLKGKVQWRRTSSGVFHAQATAMKLTLSSVFRAVTLVVEPANPSRLRRVYASQGIVPSLPPLLSQASLAHLSQEASAALQNLYEAVVTQVASDEQEADREIYRELTG